MNPGARWFVTTWQDRELTVRDVAGKVLVGAERTTTRAVAEVTRDARCARALADGPEQALAAALAAPATASPVAPSLPCPERPQVTADTAPMSCETALGRLHEALDSASPGPLRITLTTTNAMVAYRDSAGVVARDDRTSYAAVVSDLDPERHWVSAAGIGTDPAELGERIATDLAWKRTAEPGATPSQGIAVIVRGAASRMLLTCALRCPPADLGLWLRDRPQDRRSSLRRRFDDAGFRTSETAIPALPTRAPEAGRIRLCGGQPDSLVTALTAEGWSRRPLTGYALLIDSAEILADPGSDGVVCLLAQPAWVVHPRCTAAWCLRIPVVLTGRMPAMSLTPLAGELPESPDEPSLVVTGLTIAAHPSGDLA